MFVALLNPLFVQQMYKQDLLVSNGQEYINWLKFRNLPQLEPPPLFWNN